MSSLIFAEDEHEAIRWIRQCYEEDQDATKQQLQNLYESFLSPNGFQEQSIVALLKLFLEFDYEEMTPVGLKMLSSAVSLDSEKIKSAALDVLGHWENRDTYNLLLNLTSPKGFLYRIQYQVLLKSFEQKMGLNPIQSTSTYTARYPE